MSKPTQADAITLGIMKHIDKEVRPLCDDDYLAVLDDLVSHLQAKISAKESEGQEA